MSDYVDLDGTSVLFLSDTQGGCRPVSLEEGTEIVASLRRLSGGGAPPPAPAPDDLGTFARADDLLLDYNAASSPEAAADAIARRYDGAASRVTVEILSETAQEARALVTAYSLPDDSIRDERLLLVYKPYSMTWELTDAGRQVRCQPGRGHTAWGDGACQ